MRSTETTFALSLMESVNFFSFCFLNSQTLRRKGEDSGGYKTCRTNRGLQGHRSSCADEVCIAHPTSAVVSGSPLHIRSNKGK